MSVKFTLTIFSASLYAHGHLCHCVYRMFNIHYEIQEVRTISPKRGNYLPCFVFLLLWVLPLGEEGCKIYLSLFINILGMTMQNRFREFSESCKMRGGVTNKPSTRQKSPKEMRRGNQRFEKVSKVKNILLTSHTSPMASKE